MSNLSDTDHLVFEDIKKRRMRYQGYHVKIKKKKKKPLINLF